ncbi:MAG: glycosyltransferase family 4 protein, partial [Gemmatimonadota bacterium]
MPGRTQRDRPWRVAILNSHPIQYFAPLYRRLNAEPDIDITVLFCSRQGLDKYHDTGFGVEVSWDVPLTEGYPHAFLPNLRRGDKEIGGFFDLVNPAVVEWLRRGFDALWVNGHAYATYVAGILAARAGGTHVLMRTETHQGLSRSALKRMMRKPVLRGLYGSRASFLAIGSRNRDFYRTLGIQADRIFVVPYAVDNAFFRDRAREARTRRQEVRRTHGLPEEASIVLFASKLTERKKPDHLLEAFAALLRRLPDAHLAFAGSGEMEIILRRRAASMGLHSKVSFLGFRNQSELPALFAVSDVFVLPSVNEPWGLVINEAMAAGLPVVVSAEVGAVPDLVF